MMLYEYTDNNVMYLLLSHCWKCFINLGFSSLDYDNSSNFRSDHSLSSFSSIINVVCFGLVDVTSFNRSLNMKWHTLGLCGIHNFNFMISRCTFDFGVLLLHIQRMSQLTLLIYHTLMRSCRRNSASDLNFLILFDSTQNLADEFEKRGNMFLGTLV